MSSAITVAGQTRINQLRGAEQPLVIDRMVLALIPGLDPTQPVNRTQQMPDPAHIVHTYQIPPEFKGYVNPDQVVYSMILGSDVGDFSFNWIGTVEAETGIVISVTTTPSTPKRKTDLATNTTGNNITRNVMMQFQDAQALTGVTISAETWQFDYTTWMVARIEAHDQDGGAHQLLFNRGIGKIDFFDCEIPPTGWLEANGSECPASAVRLDELINGRHGRGANGRSLLPDMRDNFARGAGPGRNLGSFQADAFQHWTGSIRAAYMPATASEGGMTVTAYGSTPAQVGVAGVSPGGNYSIGVNPANYPGVRTATETRPRNIAFLACIYAGI